MYVPSRAVADEVVQDTWLGVIKGIDRFEGRSSLKTWIFRIMMNIARTKGVAADRRCIPFAAARGAMSEDDEPAFDPDKFRPASDPQYPFNWASFPTPWEHEPAERLDAAETLAVVRAAIAQLPNADREVLTLRDIQGWNSSEICNALDITETNQRVLCTGPVRGFGRPWSSISRARTYEPRTRRLRHLLYRARRAGD